jgi:hypothetical protein
MVALPELLNSRLRPSGYGAPEEVTPINSDKSRVDREQAQEREISFLVSVLSACTCQIRIFIFV